MPCASTRPSTKEQSFSPRNTFLHGTLRHDIAGIVGHIALFAQCVQHDNGFVVDTGGLPQQLNHGAVMAGHAGERPVAVRLLGGIGELMMAL